MSSIRWVCAVALASGCAATGDDGASSDASTGSVAETSDAGDVTGVSASETSAPGTADDSATGISVTGVSASGGEEAGDDEAGGGIETGGTSSPCIGDSIALENVVFEVQTNRVFGEDAPVAFDPTMDWACLQDIDGGVRIRVQHGPPLFGEPGSLLTAEIRDGARLYDLATDPDPPGGGSPGLIQLGYMVPFEPAGVAVFDTINTAGTGTVDVIALPGAGEVTVELHAAGEIGGSDGWAFDLHFTAIVPVD